MASKSRQFAYDVFLSYSSKDKAIVQPLAERLREDGVRVWFDGWEIKPGDDIFLKVEYGLQDSRALVLAISANSLGSDWVMLERGTALFRDPTNSERRFVPLLTQDCDIPDVIRRYRHIDWREGTDTAYVELLESCRQLPRECSRRRCPREEGSRSPDFDEPIAEAIRRALGLKDGEAIPPDRLSEVQSLDFYLSQVMDAGLQHLKTLTSLQVLYLGYTEVTDAGLQHLKSLTNMSSLNLFCCTQVTDAGLQHLKTLTRLQVLDLGGTQVTDAGLLHLKTLTGLRELCLVHTQVTDAGLLHLKTLTGLEELSLSSTPVTGAGLQHLKALTGLQALFLSGTQMTDAGLQHLKVFSELRTLSLRSTQVTDAGVEELKKAIPGLSVSM